MLEDQPYSLPTNGRHQGALYRALSEKLSGPGGTSIRRIAASERNDLLLLRCCEQAWSPRRGVSENRFLQPLLKESSSRSSDSGDPGTSHLLDFDLADSLHRAVPRCARVSRPTRALRASAVRSATRQDHSCYVLPALGWVVGGAYQGFWLRCLLQLELTDGRMFVTARMVTSQRA